MEFDKKDLFFDKNLIKIFFLIKILTSKKINNSALEN